MTAIDYRKKIGTGLFWLVVLFPFVLRAETPSPVALGDRPNILFIAIDDMRDWVHYLGYEQVKTPNLDRLAARGEYFTRNYCAAPVCNPSRTALLSGLRPSTSGVYSNTVDWRRVPLVQSVPRIPTYFRDVGHYDVFGAGKIYHESFNQDRDWTGYFTPDFALKKLDKYALTSDPGVKSLKFRPLSCDDSAMADYQSVSYCIDQLNKMHGQPLFLACGIYKPHLPWEVPKKYYDMYPLDKIQLPKVLPNDLDDVPPIGRQMALQGGLHAAILKSGRWKEAVQAYLAAISFADAMVGRLLDAFDKSPYKDNTLIVLWSDHGWHLGEKEHWKKFTLWEEATRSPLIWVVPGLTKPGSVCNRTVDYMDVYPTLCDLAGLPIPPHVEGVSIKSLLANADAPWNRPALTTYLFNNHAVRSEKWRYIRYSDGTEELYDHDVDPLEWKNLASNPLYASVKIELAKWMPKVNAPVPVNALQKGQREAD